MEKETFRDVAALSRYMVSVVVSLRQNNLKQMLFINSRKKSFFSLNLVGAVKAAEIESEGGEGSRRRRWA